jgi:hypothetical protein
MDRDTMFAKERLMIGLPEGFSSHALSLDHAEEAVKLFNTVGLNIMGIKTERRDLTWQMIPWLFVRVTVSWSDMPNSGISSNHMPDLM